MSGPYRFGDIHGPKPYEFIGFGDIHGPKPYEFIRFGDVHGPKPYIIYRVLVTSMAPKPSKCIGFGDIHGPKPYTFIGLVGPKPSLHRYRAPIGRQWTAKHPNKKTADRNNLKAETMRTGARLEANRGSGGPITPNLIDV